jgi:hypothetical protein
MLAATSRAEPPPREVRLYSHCLGVDRVLPERLRDLPHRTQPTLERRSTRADEDAHLGSLEVQLHIGTRQDSAH